VRVGGERGEGRGGRERERERMAPKREWTMDKDGAEEGSGRPDCSSRGAG
jgi:hypothetical protein